MVGHACVPDQSAAAMTDLSGVSDSIVHDGRSIAGIGPLKKRILITLLRRATERQSIASTNSSCCLRSPTRSKRLRSVCPPPHTVPTTLSHETTEPLLKLLLWPQLICVPTLLLPAVGRSRRETCLQYPGDQPSPTNPRKCKGRLK